MVSPLYESVHVVSGLFSVRIFFRNIRTEMISVLYLYEPAICDPPRIASAQNISDKFHTDMFFCLYESVRALSGCLYV